MTIMADFLSFDSDSDSTPNGYVVLCRTFHTIPSQVQIPILLSTVMGSESVNVNER